MEQGQTITALAKGVVGEMERLNYTSLTIRGFRYDCNAFKRYAFKETGTEIFTKELGEKYLKDKYGYPFENQRPVNSMEGNAIRCVRRLGEYAELGKILRPRKPKLNDERQWGHGDDFVIKTYLEFVQTADNSEATKHMRTHHIRMFYEFLESRGLGGTKDVTAQVISEYALSMAGDSQVYTKHRLATLRFFFRYLHKNGLSEQDFSVFVPKVKVPQNLNVPALWEKSEIELLLKSIDRGSPAGKRDYAVILLAVQLGLRIHDIAELRLNCLKWESRQLNFIQHKTGNRATHHLPGDVGWAIIDYIRYARPKAESEHIFLTVNAPYTKLVPGSVTAILKRHMLRCGIRKLPGTVSGMHSLRHALARRLLEQGTSLQGVADLMGHSKYSSTLPYLKSEIEGLRECALSLKEVTPNA